MHALWDLRLCVDVTSMAKAERYIYKKAKLAKMER